MLNQFLTSIGLTNKEAKVYLALLQIGSQAVSTIANKSQLTRTTVYAVLESLEKKDLIFSFEKNNILYYSAKSPHSIQEKLERDSGKIKSQLEEFKNLVPEFLALNQHNEAAPRVQYFEGLSGIQQIYEDTLKANKEKLAYSPIADIQHMELKKYIDEYVKKRAKKKIRVRALLPDSPRSREFTKIDESLLRATRLIPQERFPFRSEINIYNNKVAMISLQADVFHGVIIESEAIASTQRSIFELAWLGAERVMRQEAQRVNL